MYYHRYALTLSYMKYYSKSAKNAPIAQLDRASGYGPGGCGFELYWARQVKIEPVSIKTYRFYLYVVAIYGQYRSKDEYTPILFISCY